MIHGFDSSILSEDFIEHVFRRGMETAPRDSRSRRARARLIGWWSRTARSVGPASGARTILDRSVRPLLGTLGFRLGGPVRLDSGLLVTTVVTPTMRCGLLVAPYQHDLAAVWRDAVRFGLQLHSTWCFCTNAVQLQLVDARRTYARRFITFDLDEALADDRTFDLLWALCHADRLARLDEVVAASGHHGARVSASLHQGVHAALIEIGSGLAASWRRPDPLAVFDESLTILYRLLFLLFAEARGLAPMWHPVYRDSYSIESLRSASEAPGCPRGLWEALQAIGRLAQAGCDADDLKVTAFNGALFAPGENPLGESARVTDEGMRRALMSLTTRASRDGRDRIAYGDLGVEQLGSVYETVLDYVPQPTPRQGRSPVTLVRREGHRKASGTFYTPRSLTDFLVRRTLHPLCDDRSADQILALRVLDPAMGSGAFLVGACRYLASAYERALVRDAACTAADISETDRIAFRRLVAQRCLYGVDINPMAIQLARLSLWLATLAADAPLSFLDHHLRTGNSLLGASIGDLINRPNPGISRGTALSRTLPLFDEDSWERTLRTAVPARLSLGLRPDDSVDSVRDKTRILSEITARDSPLGRWKTVADVWCACWLWSAGGARLPRAAFSAVSDAVLGGRSPLPQHELTRWLSETHMLAAARRLFHWPLEFPEAFFDSLGDPLPDGGFHAVIGNPPWEMLRADHGSDAERRDMRVRGAAALHFIRRSGIYSLVREGHANCYQLFLERALQLAARGGRIGLVLPSGLAIDRGSAALRHALLERTRVDTLLGFDNHRAIFPIHRSVRFLLITSTNTPCTRSVRARFGISDPAWLDSVPDEAAARPDLYPIAFTPALLRKWSGDACTIPELRQPIDLQIREKIVSRVPALGDPDGWQARFGRELNATDDRRHFDVAGHGLPVLEGKHLDPFRVRVRDARHAIHARDATRLLGAHTFTRPRLAYREVASATNRLTLIAAIVPRGAVTTHTLFCLKTRLSTEEQWFLCGVFNSFVANYLVRPQVSTHVTAAIVERLPVPKPARAAPAFAAISALARQLARTPTDQPAYATLQAEVAQLYGLTVHEFAHVLSTFPLVQEGVREASLRSAERILAGRTTA